jgi:transcriptional regulator with XRE-family HTH domain
MTKLTIGENIKPARERLGWSMSECARKIGITPFYWQRIETNKELPSEDVLKAVSRALFLDYPTMQKIRGQIKKEKSDTKAAEKKVLMWMRDRQKDPAEVLTVLEREFGF